MLGGDSSISISLAEIICQEVSNSMNGIESSISTSGRGISKSSIHSRFSDITNLRTSHSFSEHSNTSCYSEFFVDMDALNMDSSDSSWIDSSNNCNDVPTFTTNNPEPKNHIHFGKDLSEFSDNSSDYHGKAMSVGTRKVFVIGNNNLLKVMTP